MQLNQKGSFSARAFTAGGALPVVGATVRIFGAEEGNADVYFSLVTDNDGVTEVITLPAPAEEYSLTPNPNEPPFAIYDVQVVADGYYEKRILGIKIFASRHTDLPINMIPDSGNGAEDFPRGNVNANIN